MSNNNNDKEFNPELKEHLEKILIEYWENPNISTDKTLNDILTQFHIFLELFKVYKRYDYKTRNGKLLIETINESIRYIHKEKYKKAINP